MEESCIFCKIIKGEIPSYTVYEDDSFKVVLDRFPASKGHMLVLPKKHIENIFELDEKYEEDLMKVVKKMCKLVKEKLNPSGINILQNNGKAAGQTVFHYHVHIIPRYEKDENIKISWNTLKLSDEEIQNYLYEIIN